MDFAKPWVENICQKFENMCQEVEVIVCKEAKYVENQVQSVGANVKKFCTDIVQDFVPPSSVDTVKEIDCNACIEKDRIKDNPSHEESKVTAFVRKKSPRKSTSSGICNVRNSPPPSSVNHGKGAGVDSVLDGTSFLMHEGCKADAYDDNEEDRTPGPGLSETVSPTGSEASPVSSPRSESHFNPLSSREPAIGSDSVASDLSLAESENKTPASRLSETTASLGSQASPFSNPRSKSHLDPHSSRDPAIESDPDESDLSLAEGEESWTCEKSDKDIEEVPTTEKPPFPELAGVGCAVEDSDQALLSSSHSNKNYEKVGEKLTKIPLPASAQVIGCSFFPELETSCVNVTDPAECVADISNSLPSCERTDLVLSELSCENKVDESGLLPSCCILSTKSNESGASMAPNALSLMGDSSNWIEQYSEHIESGAVMSTSQIGDAFTRRSDNDDSKLAECNVGFEPIININEFDDVKLRDGCMVVDTKEFLLISSRAHNHRSYKKKILDAFASRMRSRKQREYEQLAMWFEDFDSEISTVRAESSIPSMLTKHDVSKNLSVHDIYESDWELL